MAQQVGAGRGDRSRSVPLENAFQLDRQLGPLCLICPLANPVAALTGAVERTDGFAARRVRFRSEGNPSLIT